MSAIRMTATAGPDGVLHLSVPAGRAGEFEVTVVFVPRPSANGDTPASAPKTPEELGWPPGYFENVIGSIKRSGVQAVSARRIREKGVT